MAEHLKSIDVDDMPDVPRLAEDVRRAGEPRVLRRNSEDLVMVLPLPAANRSWRGRAKTAADYEAFRRAAGGWADVNTDRLIADIYEDRVRSTRPTSPLSVERCESRGS